MKLKTSESAAGAREKDAGKKGKGKEKDGAAVRLMDLASLVPRGGRGVGVLVGEKEVSWWFFSGLRGGRGFLSTSPPPLSGGCRV